MACGAVVDFPIHETAEYPAVDTAFPDCHPLDVSVGAQGEADSYVVCGVSARNAPKGLWFGFGPVVLAVSDEAGLLALYAGPSGAAFVTVGLQRELLTPARG